MPLLIPLTCYYAREQLMDQSTEYLLYIYNRARRIAESNAGNVWHSSHLVLFANGEVDIKLSTTMYIRYVILY